MYEFLNTDYAYSINNVISWTGTYHHFRLKSVFIIMSHDMFKLCLAYAKIQKTLFKVGIQFSHQGYFTEMKDCPSIHI